MPVFIVSESYTRDLVVRAPDAEAALSLGAGQCEVISGEGYVLENRCVSEAPSIIGIPLPHPTINRVYVASSLDTVTGSQRILSWTPHDTVFDAQKAAEEILSAGFGELSTVS